MQAILRLLSGVCDTLNIAQAYEGVHSWTGRWCGLGGDIVAVLLRGALSVATIYAYSRSIRSCVLCVVMIHASCSSCGVAVHVELRFMRSCVSYGVAILSTDFLENTGALVLLTD